MKKTVIAGAALFLSLFAGMAWAQDNSRAGANSAVQSQSSTHGSKDDALIYNQGVDAYNAKHYAEAADLFTKYLKTNGKDSQAHKLLAGVYFQQNKPALAVPELETALKLAPKDTEARDNLGAAYLQAGSFDKAADLYQTARLQNPKDAQLALYEGLALTQAGKNEAAVTALQDAIKIDPKNPAAFLQLGVALESSGKHTDAAAAFQTASDLNPKDARAALYAGVLGHQTGNDAKAVPDLKLALALETDNPFAARMSLGEVYATAGKTDDAIAEYKAASDLKPEDFGAAANLGILTQKEGKTADAEAAYRRAVGDKAPTPQALAPVQSNLAMLLVADGKLEDAAPLLTQATQNDATNAHYEENLGLVYEKQSKTDLALAAYGKALEIDPALTDAKESIARLKK